MKLLNKIICLCTFSIILSFTGCSIQKTSNKLPDTKPEDFNFVLNYGINAKNQMYTAKGQFTKDMVSDPPISVALNLTDDEMESIYSEMKKINILNYPDNFSARSNKVVTPFYTYRIKITAGGKEKNIYWADENLSESRDAIQFRNLFKKIEDIIKNREEYKKLPQPKGAYK